MGAGAPAQLAPRGGAEAVAPLLAAAQIVVQPIGDLPIANRARLGEATGFQRLGQNRVDADLAYQGAPTLDEMEAAPSTLGADGGQILAEDRLQDQPVEIERLLADFLAEGLKVCQGRLGGEVLVLAAGVCMQERGHRLEHPLVVLFGARAGQLERTQGGCRRRAGVEARGGRLGGLGHGGRVSGRWNRGGQARANACAEACDEAGCGRRMRGRSEACVNLSRPQASIVMDGPMTGEWNMNTKLRLLRRLWPLVCGLVVGGLLGGLTRSWSIGALAGGVAWLFFYVQMHSTDDGNDDYDPNRVVGLWEVPNPADLEQQITLRRYGQIGIGRYANQYPRDDLR